MTICQNQKLTLHCSGGKVIKVHYANYGRTSYHICPRGTLLTDDCEGHNTKKIVKRKCNGRRRCRLRATNAIYGNPCRGTTKYLEVKFSCVGKKWNIFQNNDNDNQIAFLENNYNMNYVRYSKLSRLLFLFRLLVGIVRVFI